KSILRIGAQILERKHGDAFFHDRYGGARRSPQKEHEGSDNRGQYEQPEGHFGPAHLRAMSLNRLKLLGKLRIADFIVVKVCDPDTHSVFYFASPKIVQEGSPMFVFS